jgi:uncharacterized delta-60 repeat protein
MRRTRLTSAIVAVSLLLTAALVTGLAAAAIGDLDPSFDGDGRQTTDFTASGEDRASDVAIQSDGKILVAGSDAGNTVAVARYNSDGSLDSSFDGDGKLTVAFISPGNQSPSVAVQPDGKIVVAGGHNGDFGVARFTSQGAPETQFGPSNGQALADFAGNTDNPVAVAIAPDGDIVVAGDSQAAAAPSEFALARFDSNGDPDGSFGGGDGQQTATFTGADGQRARDMALESDGDIVMAGEAFFTSETHFALMRFLGNGNPDDSFHDDGQLTTPVGDAGADAVAVSPGDAKIMAAGSDGSGHFAVASYNGSDGSTDSGFGVGGDGIAIADFGPGISADAQGVAIQSDGKIVAAGEADGSQSGQPIQFGIARFDGSGSPDGTFSGDGTQLTAFPNVSAAATDLALQADGKPVAVGGTDEPGSKGDFAVARYQVTDPPPPPPPPPCCAPPDRLTLADLPDPVQGISTNVEPIRGQVFVGIPAGLARAASARTSQKGVRFVPLTEARQIPMGSFLDTRRGTVRLQSARDRQGTRQNGDFSQGLFQALQSRQRSARGLTTLVLKGSSFRSCRRPGRGKRASAAQSIRRRLRANARGRFRTRGRHSAATVRGTVWLTADRCDGTLTRVTRGRVAVRDFRRKRTVLVRAGKSYLARAR